MSVSSLQLRDLVFQAATRIARKGGRVTVSSVWDVIGWGNPSELQDYLVEWRQERRDSRQQQTQLVPTPSDQLLPVLVSQVIDQFTHQLGLTWADALAASSTDDQLTVIRAAAEARIREATDQMHLFEEDVVRLKNDILAYETEKSALNTALDEANERAAQVESMSAHYRQQVHELQQIIEERIAAYEASEAIYQKRLSETDKEVGQTVTKGLEGPAHEDQMIEKINDLQQEIVSLQVSLTEKEQIISHQQMQLQAHHQQQALLVDKEKQIVDYQETIQKQQNWIQEARQRMARAGLIRGKNRKFRSDR